MVRWALFRLHHMVQYRMLIDRARGFAYHVLESSRMSILRLCDQQTLRLAKPVFSDPSVIPVLPVYPLPFVDVASSKTNPSIILNHADRPTTRQSEAINFVKDTYVHIANGNTTHFCGLEGSEEGVGERVGWRKSRWAGSKSQNSRDTQTRPVWSASWSRLCAVGSLSLFGLAVP
jgi:hypothetical protein